MKVPFSIDGNKFAGMQYACGKPNFIKLLSRKNLEFLQANQIVIVLLLEHITLEPMDDFPLSPTLRGSQLVSATW